jgi:hypothetical protein
LDALRSKETFDNVIFTDDTFVEMGADGRLFFCKRTSDLDILPAEKMKGTLPPTFSNQKLVFFYFFLQY